MRIHDVTQFEDALRRLSDTHAQLLLQREIRGRDLRIIVLDGEILCGIERKAPDVTGDGRRSVTELIDGNMKITASDDRIDATLARQGLTRDSIPGIDEKIELLPVTNLSAGGTAEIVTDRLEPESVESALKATAALGLRYAGVDMILPEGGQGRTSAVVLEVNAAPGLNNLYRQGPLEANCVRAIYAVLFGVLFEK